MSKLAEYLNQNIVGNVFEQPAIREAYSRDDSILQIMPKIVAVPENVEDIRHILRFVNQLAARDLRLPVAPRGAGTDKTGASLTPGMVLSLEKLNQIEEIDVRGRLVRVQPGITLGQLNSALHLHGLWLPIGHHDKATIGGLIAGCPTDDMANRYGGIFRYVERVEIVLPNGDLVQLSPHSQRSVDAIIATDSAESVIYRKIRQILDEQADVILDRSMHPFDARGYANITRIHEGHTLNLLPLLFASQGTLGVITDVILRVDLLPPPPKRLLISFHDQKTALRFLNYASELNPYQLRVYDLNLLETAAEFGKRSSLFTRKLGKGLLVQIGFDHHRLKNLHQLKRCLSALPDTVLRIIEDDQNSAEFSALSNLLTCYLNNSSNTPRTPLLDEVFVPSMHFGEFLNGLKNLERTFNRELPIFGSFINASYNVRPDFDCTTVAGRRQIVEFIKAYGKLVAECQGSVTGNSPEGRLRVLAISSPIPEPERQVYATIKAAFDQYNILNPDIKLGVSARDTLKYLATQEKPGIVKP